MDMAKALEIAGWPSSLLAAEKQPTIIEDVKDFEEAILYGSHVDEILVLKDGVHKLGQADAVPPDFLDAARRSGSCSSFLDALGDETLAKLRGRVYCTTCGTRDEYELKKRADGSPLDSLADKRAELRLCPPTDRAYLGEIRQREKYRHAQDNRWAKTLLRVDVCDWLGKERAQAMPYWDRFDEGIFVGGRFAGSPMHVDQVHWSNVGKNFTGAKLLAIWEYGEPSRPMFDDQNYKLFVPPLAADETAAVASALKVALLGPGDVVVFSGANAHMALSVSADLSTTAYESFVNLNPPNLRAFLDSGTLAQYRQCRTRQPMLDDIRGDVIASANDLIDDLRDGILRDAELTRRAPAAIDELRADKAINAELRDPTTKRRKL